MEIQFSTGVVEVPVNGGRAICFNPSDMGFADTLYSLLAKIEAIDSEGRKKREKTEDLAKVFDYYRAGDTKMRQAVDAVFGEGFCADVFPGVRLTAMADGLTVIENFVFAVLDCMDEDIADNLAKRNARIARYTEKYKRHKK